MSGDEYINVQIFGFYKNRQLTIHAKRQMCKRACAAVREVQVNSYHRPPSELENESILTEVPNRERIRRRVEVSDAIHK
jgi:hypothetical protein